MNTGYGEGSRLADTAHRSYKFSTCRRRLSFMFVHHAGTGIEMIIAKSFPADRSRLDGTFKRFIQLEGHLSELIRPVWKEEKVCRSFRQLIDHWQGLERSLGFNEQL